MDQKAVGEHLKVKFTQLFTEEDVDFPPDLANLLSPILTPEESAVMCSIPSDEDVKQVIFDMQSLKAPGPDGLPPIFINNTGISLGLQLLKL